MPLYNITSLITFKLNIFFNQKIMKHKAIYFVYVIFAVQTILVCSQGEQIKLLQNPISVEYIKTHLLSTQPRLMMNSTIKQNLRIKLKTDPVIQNVYKAIKLNAAKIQTLPFLQRILEGYRLLEVSRQMLYRANMLGIVYLIDKDPIVLKRINDELLAVCQFSDWNPQHYLDVSEMSMAVSVALDWTAGNLPKQTIELALTALIQKGINPSFNTQSQLWWLHTNSNWNQVCHAGMTAAAIVIAEKDLQLAAKTIKRSLDALPYALKEYSPDGVYVQGPTYWDYGTGFSVMTSSMLESAFGTDFGIADYPAFKKSAIFKYMSNAPSGWFYNYADCSDQRSKNGDMILAWFAAKTGNKDLFERERFMAPASQMNKLQRGDGAGFIWLSQFVEKDSVKMPTVWRGDGPNPIVIFKSDQSDSHQYYFGGKGGKAQISHGNMDAGSFVFQLNGVRWVIDPGNQEYYELEKTGFNLWNYCQQCQRWNLLTKNNFGHSTITVNEALFVNSGFAPLINFQENSNPQASFDLSAVYGQNMTSVKRRFLKDSSTSLVIEDQLIISENTKLITWQLLTTADVKIAKGGAILRQDGKRLIIEVVSHPQLQISVISLYPAPLKLDRQMDGLKRIQIRIPSLIVQDKKMFMKVRLSADQKDLQRIQDSYIQQTVEKESSNVYSITTKILILVVLIMSYIIYYMWKKSKTQYNDKQSTGQQLNQEH